MNRVGQDRIYAPYMTVYLVISLPKMPYIHRVDMVLANPNDEYQGHYIISVIKSAPCLGSCFRFQTCTPAKQLARNQRTTDSHL
jgi:hypothetical protein